MTIAPVKGPLTDRCRWWLAEDLDCAVVLWQLRARDGKVLFEAAYRYQPDPEIAWRVQSWDTVFYTFRDRKKVTATYLVTESRVNEPVHPSLFRLEFPPGMDVTDRDSRRSATTVSGTGLLDLVPPNEGAEYIGTLLDEIREAGREPPTAAGE